MENLVKMEEIKILEVNGLMSLLIHLNVEVDSKNGRYEVKGPNPAWSYGFWGRGGTVQNFFVSGKGIGQEHPETVGEFLKYLEIEKPEEEIQEFLEWHKSPWEKIEYCEILNLNKGDEIYDRNQGYSVSGWGRREDRYKVLWFTKDYIFAVLWDAKNREKLEKYRGMFIPFSITGLGIGHVKVESLPQISNYILTRF